MKTKLIAAFAAGILALTACASGADNQHVVFDCFDFSHKFSFEAVQQPWQSPERQAESSPLKVELSVQVIVKWKSCQISIAQRRM